MWVIINGIKEEIKEGSTVAEAMARWEEHDINVIVEINHRYIHPRSYTETILKEGDHLELINPAFGG